MDSIAEHRDLFLVKYGDQVDQNGIQFLSKKFKTWEDALPFAKAEAVRYGVDSIILDHNQHVKTWVGKLIPRVHQVSPSGKVCSMPGDSGSSYL